MIEIRETANGQAIYVDGYYVGTIHDDNQQNKEDRYADNNE
jgi:hypothetical protein